MPPKRTVASPSRTMASPSRAAAGEQQNEGQRRESALDPARRPADEPTAEREQPQREQHEQPQGRADEGDPQTARERVLSQTCAVCLTQPADFLCSPCGHQCGCETCLRQVQASGGSKWCDFLLIFTVLRCFATDSGTI